MHVTRRSGRLALVSVVASLFFAACQTPREHAAARPSIDDEPATPPVQETQAEPVDGLEAEEATVGEAEESAELPEPKPERRDRARSVEDQAEWYGAVAREVPGSNEWRVSKEQRSLSLTESSRVATVDDVKVYLDTPLRQKRGRWILGESDASILLKSVFGEREELPRGIRTIMIDPGHGGSEDGTKNEALGLLEKELNLDVSQRLRDHLEKLGFRALLTRYEDRLVKLEQRPTMANGAKADLFISIHFNAAANRDASGIETFLLASEGQKATSGKESDAGSAVFAGNRFDLQNFTLGLALQESLVKRLNRKDRGLKKSHFAVLKSLECPGVLVECGFLSNEEEALLISTAGYRERVARALAAGIAKYAGKELPVERSN